MTVPGGTSADPLHVALLCETDDIGGAETMLFNLATGLRGRGHRVSLVAPAGRHGALTTRFRDAGFGVHGFTLRRAVDPACVRALAELFRAERVDVANGHMFTMAVYGAAAARRAGIAHVLTMHGTGHETSALRRRMALRWAMRRSAALVAVSSALKSELRGVLGRVADRMQVLPNGIAPTAGRRDTVRRELGVGDDELLVLAVGNLYENKGHLVLLQALAQLPAGIPWRVAIAGREEDATPALRAFIQAQGWERRAHLLGPRGDVPNLLAAADVYAMPSYREALPMALLEAMMSGTAVVASHVGGIPEVIAEGRDGLLVPPGSSDALAAALRRVLTDAPLRAALGTAAESRARLGYGMDAMIHAYEAVYTAARAAAGAPKTAALAPARA